MSLVKVGGVMGPAPAPAPARGEEAFSKLFHEMERGGASEGLRGRATAGKAIVAPEVGRAGGAERPLEIEPRKVGQVSASAERGVTAAARAASGGVTAVRLADQVAAAQRRLEHVLRVAESGRTFTPAELLALQAHAYRASQELDLAGKVVEKAAGGVKQILQTQV